MNIEKEFAYAQKIFVLISQDHLNDANLVTVVTELYFLYCKQFQIVILEPISNMRSAALATELSSLGLPVEKYSHQTVENGKIEVPRYLGQISCLYIDDYHADAWAEPQTMFEDWNQTDLFSKTISGQRWNPRQIKPANNKFGFEFERPSNLSALLRNFAQPAPIRSDTIIIEDQTTFSSISIETAMSEGRNIVSADCSLIGRSFIDLLHSSTVAGLSLNFNASIGGSAPIIELIKCARKQSRIKSAEIVIDTSVARTASHRTNGIFDTQDTINISKQLSARRQTIQAEFDILSFAIYGKTLPEIDPVLAYPTDARSLLNRWQRQRTKEIIRMENTSYGPKASFTFDNQFQHDRISSLKEHMTGVCVTLEDNSTWFASGTDANPISKSMSLLAQLAI